MNHREQAQFRATTGSAQGFGATPQNALAALMQSVACDATRPIVIWPYNRGDAFFTEAQQARLRDLKARRRSLAPEECAELDGLTAEALDATVARTQSLPLTKS